jgi:hypothetical protein
MPGRRHGLTHVGSCRSLGEVVRGRAGGAALDSAPDGYSGRPMGIFVVHTNWLLYRGSRESMSSWGRFHRTRATDVATPPTTDIHVGSWSPHRICPRLRRSARPMPFTGLSAVHTGGAAQSFLAARSDRAVARRPYRAEALTPCRTGRPAGAGLVPRTGREPGGDAEGTTDCTFLGGPLLSTGCGFRPKTSRPYRAGGGSLRAGQGAVPVVPACRSRASRRFWWTQHNNRLHQSIAVVTPLVPSGAPTPAPGGAGPRSLVRRSVGRLGLVGSGR